VQAFADFRKTMLVLACSVPEPLENGTQPDLKLDFSIVSTFNVSAYDGSKGLVSTRLR